MSSNKELQERWRYLYQDYLPAMAKARDPAQPKWSVHLDHCFARIILDNSLGKNGPWTEVVKSPAIKNMSDSQLESAIALAERLAFGEADLQELDQRSLELRGKTKGGKRKAVGEGSDVSVGTKKQKKVEPTVSSYFLPSRASPSTKPPKEEVASSPEKQKPQHIDMATELKRIQDSNITAFRKQTLSMLCQIPRGRYSTYGAMADWISNNSHKTCARAVGNAMRNNPFAPEVPCHRILAGNGTLGGFKGSWGEEGTYAKDKRELLHEEGVRFDSKGKVKGPVFREFWELEK